VAVDKPSKASVRSVEPPVRADTAPGEAASGVHLATAASTTDAGARAAASASTASDQPRWVTRVAYLGGPPSPRYPAAAQRRGQTGKVIVRVLISPQGNVVNASIEKSSGHVLLDDAALDAVQRARFKPYTENGVAHSARADIPIDFVL
jgi:protein TonB